MDKLGVLRPLSLPPNEDGSGRAFNMEGKEEKVWEKTKGGQKAHVMVRILVKCKYAPVIITPYPVTL